MPLKNRFWGRKTCLPVLHFSGNHVSLPLTLKCCLFVCLFFSLLLLLLLFLLFIIINGLNIFYLLLIPAHSSSTSGWTRMHTIYYTVSTLKRSAESEGHNMRKKLGRFDQYSTYRPGFWPGSCSCHDEQNSCFQVHNRNLHWTTITGLSANSHLL